jgi:hypothetical protein
MRMLYHSENYVVVHFEVPGEAVVAPLPGEAPGPTKAAAAAPAPALSRHGFEIVDKHARREIWIEGAAAEGFRAGVRSLMASDATPEALDEFIGRWTRSRRTRCCCTEGPSRACGAARRGAALSPGAASTSCRDAQRGRLAAVKAAGPP